MSAKRMNDAQLKAVVYRIVQTYLEVERGLRPPGHLQLFLTPDEYGRHRSVPRPDRPRLGPVQMQEMGPVHFERHGDDEISASVLTRRGEERWGSLLLHLQARDDGWQVDQLERLEHAVELPEATEHDVPDPDTDLDRRIKLAELERSLVDAVMIATADRIGEIGDRRIGASRQLSERLERWASRLSDLDEELETLGQRRSLPGLPNPAREQRHGRDLSLDVEELLGPRPDEAQQARDWDRTAADIEAYRQRWGLGDDERPLGGPAEDDHQQLERRKLVQQIRDFHHRPEIQTEHSASRSTPPSPGLGPDL